MKKILFFSALFAVLAIVPISAYGATFKINQDYNLNSGSTVNDNVYAAGSNVNIAGIITGDLFAAGGNVLLFGPINADLAAVGGTLNINGNVVGDMRLAGGNINITSSAGGELLVAGGQINVMPGSVINRDAKIAGGVINYSGNIAGGAVIRGDKVYINGTIEKDLSVKAREITLGPTAVIKGNFEYFAPKEAAVDSGAKIMGTVNFHKTELPSRNQTRGFIFGIFTLALLVKTIILVVTSLAVLYFAGTHAKLIVRGASSNFWNEAGKGLILFIVAPIVIIIGLITVAGAALGVIALFVYLSLAAIASIISALLFAQLALKCVFKKENYELKWWVVILAVLVLGLIGLIPLVGGLFTFVIFLASLGSLSGYVLKKFKG